MSMKKMDTKSLVLYALFIALVFLLGLTPVGFIYLPIAAITTCLLVSRVIGVEKIEEEVTLEGKPFRRKRIFNFMIKYLCPIFAAIILISSVANALGVISM